MAAPLKARAPRAAAEPGAVLTKALVNAARAYGVSQSRIAAVLGVSESTASRLFGGAYVLDPSRAKEWELAALFVRLFRSLDSLVGSDEKARAWLTSANRALGARPIDLVSSAEGLVRVLHYLDAARGRI